MRVRCAAAVTALGVTALGILWGAPATAQTFGVWFDNDIIAGNDQYYTNGIQLYYITPERLIGGVDWLSDQVPGAAMPTKRRYGFALGQKMFTPRDLTRENPNPKDQPYAGWLYGRLSVVTEEATQVDLFELDLGVVGPLSLAEDTQKFVHRIVSGSTYPRGWSYQLENEPGVVLTYQRAWRTAEPQRVGPFQMDVTPHALASVGNIVTFAGGGATIRFGQGMEPLIGPLVDRPITPIPYQDSVGRGFTWYLYASTEARLIARNIFLDGNSFRDSRSVDKIPGVATVQAGLTVKYDRLSLTAAYNVTTPEFTEQQGFAKYGSLRVSFRF